MIYLNLDGKPIVLKVADGVTLTLRPLSSAVVVAAQTDPYLLEAIRTKSDAEVSVAFAVAVAKKAIINWEGVGDADGLPVDVSADNIAGLMDIWPILQKFQAKYVEPAMALVDEKNA